MYIILLRNNFTQNYYDKVIVIAKLRLFRVHNGSVYS